MKILLNIMVQILIVLLLGQSALAAAEQQAFTVDSLKLIEDRYAGKPFLLVLWEISCLPCRQEMVLLGELRKSHPLANIVMVSNDDFSQQNEISGILNEHGLTGVDSWIFAGLNVERLRYVIDPDWFGELPRNYFYDADSSRVGFSGKLTEPLLQKWLSM